MPEPTERLRARPEATAPRARRGPGAIADPQARCEAAFIWALLRGFSLVFLVGHCSSPAGVDPHGGAALTLRRGFDVRRL